MTRRTARGHQLSGVMVGAAALVCTPASEAIAEPPAPETPRCRAFMLESMDAGVVRVDEAALRAAAAQPGPFVIEAAPLAPGVAADLEVERFFVTSAETRVVIGAAGGPGTPVPFDPDRVLLLRGSVPGCAGSHVFIAVAGGSADGTVELGPGALSYAISSRGRGAAKLPAGEARVFEGRRAGAARPAAACGYQAGRPRAPTLSDLGPPEPIRGLKQVQLAVDADYEFYSLFGDLNAATDYIVTLYGAISSLYVRDTKARIDLSFVRVWTTPQDPWGAGASFPQTGTFPPGTVWDIAQMLSGSRNVAYGGQAIGTVSYSAYTLGFFATPDAPHIYNQDIEIPAHEIGHTLGAPHTHDIQIDQCHIATTTPRRGTIMSYCSQTFSGGIALCDMRLHTKIQTLIRNTINNRPGIVNDCNQNAISDAFDISTGFSADANANGIPDECEDCNANGILDSLDISSGASLDLNSNGMPDECEPDCNRNNVPDDRDIFLGTSQDLHGNGVPDECETDCNSNAQSDYNEIMANMALDLDRNAVLDSCQDCDRDGTPDFAELGGANDAWVASLSNGQVRRYHAWSGVFVHAGTGTTLQQPQDLLITADRRILVSSAGDDRVAEYSSAGAFVGNLVRPGSGGLDAPAGMALGPDSSLLVVSRASASVLRYHGGSGAFLGVLVAPGSGGLTSPFGIAFGPTGTLLVTSANNQVLEFDGVTGAFVRVLVPAATNGGLNDPRGLLVLADPPRLIVASRANNRILQYDPATGAFVRQFNNGDYHGHLEEPWCLRLGPNGNVFASVAGALEAGPGQPLHLIDPRVFEFDERDGDLIRGYVMGQDSLAAASSGFDFMPGAGHDCNWNQVPDSCDIASGFSRDQNGNGVPDECESCHADCDGDGSLTIPDFACFFTRFVAADPYADCNQDAALTVGDFGCFQTAFVAGCP